MRGGEGEGDAWSNEFIIGSKDGEQRGIRY